MASTDLSIDISNISMNSVSTYYVTNGNRSRNSSISSNDDYNPDSNTNNSIINDRNKKIFDKLKNPLLMFLSLALSMIVLLRSEEHTSELQSQR